MREADPNTVEDHRIKRLSGYIFRFRQLIRSLTADGNAFTN